MSWPWEVTQGHWKWHRSTDRTVLHGNYGPILYHFLNKVKYRSKSWFFIPHLHLTAQLGSPHRNIAIMFGTEKLEWWVYQKVKRVWEYHMFTCFDTINKRDRQTEGQTTQRHRKHSAQCHVAKKRPRHVSRDFPSNNYETIKTWQLKVIYYHVCMISNTLLCVLISGMFMCICHIY